MSFLRVIGRIILYLLAGIGMLSAVVLIGLVTFVLSARDEPTSPDRIVLVLDFGQGVAERDHPNILEGLSQRRPLILHDALEAIRSAAGDDRVAGLVLDIGNAPINLTDAQAIRRAVGLFRKTGKFTYAFAESYGGLTNGTVAYYLATAAEKVWMQPSGTLGLVGIAIEAPFVASALNKLDVKTRYEQRHEYKGAGEIFVRSGFSPEARKSLKRLLNSWMEQIVAGIASTRDLSPTHLSYLIDNGPYHAEETREARLIDALAYRDELIETTIGLAGAEAAWLSVERYLQIAGEAAPGVKKVALIFGEGVIVPGRGGSPTVGKAQRFAADTIAGAILDAAEDDSIDAILLRIDSPGGSYGASDTVWRAIQIAKKKGKPVVASLARTAASGGYFVAMAADRIVAEAGTVTGSIGVLAVKFVTRDFWRKFGVEWDRVQVGTRAAIWSMIDDYPPGGAERVSSFLDAVYADFTKKVAEARGLNSTKLDEVARGRIWSGVLAKKVGLVDEIGGLDSGFAELRKLLNIKPNAGLDILTLPRRSRFEEIFDALRRRGIDLRSNLGPALAIFLPSASAPLTEIVGRLDAFIPPAGVLQMPTWRVAR